MSDSPSFPYVLDNVILVSVECKRAPQVPENLQTVFSAQFGVAEVGPTQLQVSLKVATAADVPVAFTVELVGSYRLIEGATKPQNEVITESVADRAFPLLWQHVAQVILELTARMAMNPIRLPMPPLPVKDTVQTIEGQQVPPSQ